MNKLNRDAKSAVRHLLILAKDIDRRLGSSKPLHPDNYIETCDQHLNRFLNPVLLDIITPTPL